MVGHCGGVRQIPTIWSVPPEHLYCEGAPRAKASSRLELPFQVGSRKLWGATGVWGPRQPYQLHVVAFCRLGRLLRVQVTGGSSRMQPGTRAVA